MIRTILTIALAAGTAVAAAGSASAEDKHPRRAPTVTAKAFGGASAPYVRMAAVVDSQTGVVRSKGVSGLRRVYTGAYCIESSSLSAATLATLVPVVTVDFTGSDRAGALAQFRDRASSGNPCNSLEIAVMTYGFVDGVFRRVNDIGFTLLVP